MHQQHGTRQADGTARIGSVRAKRGIPQNRYYAVKPEAAEASHYSIETSFTIFKTAI